MEMTKWQKVNLSVKIHICSPLILAVLLWLCMLQGCGENSLDEQQSGDAPQVLSVNTFEVPVFETPEQQLHYGQSVFEEPLHKRAALQAVCKVFPEKRKFCGLAALDLAYLSLGPDYRTAQNKVYQKAVAGYQGILDEYGEYREVAAKASWYLGWLHCDLLGDKETGLSFYRDIVERYPDVNIHLDLPVPEVASLYTNSKESSPPVYSRSIKSWATVALVEIARYATDPQDIHFALHKLAGGHDNDLATGMAIKLVVGQGKLPVRSKPIVADYLEEEASSLYLKQDIKAALIINRPGVE